MEMTVRTSDLQHQIDALSTRLFEQDERLAEQNILIAKQNALIKYYEEQFLLLRRRQFGSSSEKTDSDLRQINLFSETAAPKPDEPETEEISYTRKKRKGKREEDLSGLPVERIDYELPEEERDCPRCGLVMGDIGVDIRRGLKLIPAQVVVEEHAAHVYACDNCNKNSDSTPIFKTELPKPLIGGSLASPSLVAHIAVQKYLNGMPLYRIERGFQFDGVIISRQTMVNWVMVCVENYLIAIYNLFITYLLAEYSIHSDETTHQVLREPGRKATSKSYEWVYRTSRYATHPIVIFDYQQTREQKHPQRFLADYKGLLHADGYQAYHSLPEGIIVVGCWAHARRKWENLSKTIPAAKRKDSDAQRGVDCISRLFELERQFDALPPEERLAKRQTESKPLAEEFFAWAESLGALPKSLLGEAVHYTLSQRPYLMNVFTDGCAELSNNRAERTVKSFVIGRKAWLFSVTPRGAYATSVMYSIIETARENGLHPYHYIKFLLEILPNTSTDGLESLLPWSDSLPESCYAPVKGLPSNRKN
jgi:transposase